MNSFLTVFFPQVLANWIKLVIGLCLMMVTFALVIGRVSVDDFIKLISFLVASHALTSGVSGILSKTVSGTSGVRTEGK